MDDVVPPVAFRANPMDWNGNELADTLNAYSCVVYQDFQTTDYLIRGDGVRLRMPYMWLVDMDAELLTVAVLNGIKASRDHMHRLGY